jgi:hypothetical protein
MLSSVAGGYASYSSESEGHRVHFIVLRIVWSDGGMLAGSSGVLRLRVQGSAVARQASDCARDADEVRLDRDTTTFRIPNTLVIKLSDRSNHVLLSPEVARRTSAKLTSACRKIFRFRVPRALPARFFVQHQRGLEQLRAFTHYRKPAMSR